MPSQSIAKHTMLLYGLMLLIMAVSLHTSRVVLNTLGVEDCRIYNVDGADVSMVDSVNGLLTLTNGGKTSCFGFLAMKTTVKPFGNSFPKSGQRNPTRANLDKLGSTWPCFLQLEIK